MKTGLFYLNNKGNKWVVLENGKKSKITLTTKTGNDITRTVQFYSSFGNFATARISYKGKNIDVFNDSILED